MATLVEELPFAAVVEDKHLANACSSCFSSEGNLSRCIRCKVVRYCDKACQNKDWVDHKHECAFLKNYSPDIPPTLCRLIARIAMKLKRPDANKPSFNGRIYEDLMDHSDEIKKDPKRMKDFFFYSLIIGKHMGEKFVFDWDHLMSIYGKIEINSFGIVIDDCSIGIGLYLGLSVHDHSCAPEGHVIFDGCKALLRSPDINKKYSKDLTITYTRLLRSNQYRQQELKAFYYFDCTCARCSDPTLDFLHNSARSTCCPDSYCPLDPDANELSCNKCGSISGITVEEAVVANEEVKKFDAKENSLVPNVTFDLPTLIEAYEKFSKILSPLNLNLLMLNEKLLEEAFIVDNGSSLCRKYNEKSLPAYRRYLSVGDLDLSSKLMFVALSMSLTRPPTKQVLKLIEESYAAFSVSHGLEHRRTLRMDQMISSYQNRLQLYTSRGIDMFK